MRISFTAELSDKHLAGLMNTWVRPAGPSTVTAYEGANRQAVTTTAPAITAPLDVTVVVDPDVQIIRLLFTPGAPDD